MSPPAADRIDPNSNGIPELVIRTMFLGARDGTMSMYDYEWDGEGFTSRLPRAILHPCGDLGLAFVEFGAVHLYNGSARFEDVDGNGSVEILLSGGGRDFHESSVWMWDGNVFALTSAKQ